MKKWNFFVKHVSIINQRYPSILMCVLTDLSTLAQEGMQTDFIIFQEIIKTHASPCFIKTEIGKLQSHICLMP